MFPRTLLKLLSPAVRARDARAVGRRASVELEHIGRKTGKTYHTLVRGFRTGHVVVIPANFGAQSDWVQNVLSAGGCRIREMEKFRQMGTPRLIAISDARPYLPLWFYIGLRYVILTKPALKNNLLSWGSVIGG
jgi:deazaflavin-dependent oxidoreductase (nitroreductase family)